MRFIAKTIKYVFIVLIAIMVSKYLILWYAPSSQVHPVPTPTNIPIQQPAPKPDVELSIEYDNLKVKVEDEYNTALNEINGYTSEQINGHREKAYRRLTIDDGFLDWIFDYFTGYEMMWKKAKGVIGSEDNEIKLVSDKFQKDVIDPEYDIMIANIQSYSAHRIDDYYKKVIVITSEYINEQTTQLKLQGYSDMVIEQNSIPWNKHIASVSTDGVILLELTGVTTVGVITGKVVGGKVAALLGPKMLSLITAKTVTVVGAKIAALYSFILAPIVDIAVNEAAKQIQYDESKSDFEKMIDEILEEGKKSIDEQVRLALDETKNSIYDELNKQTLIKAKK